MTAQVAYEIARRLCDGEKRKDLMEELQLSPYQFSNIVYIWLSRVAPRKLSEYPKYKDAILYNIEIEKALTEQRNLILKIEVALIEASRAKFKEVE